MIGSPVMLVDSGVLSGPQGTWEPNLENMQSLTNDHVLIDEMRIWGHVPDYGEAEAHSTSSALGTVQMSLTAGRHSLTNGYVGTSRLGPAAERFAQLERVRAGSNTLNDVAYITRWHFPRPFAVEAGTPLRPSFRRQAPDGNLLDTHSVYLSVAFIGRVIDEMPAKTCVPYVSDYTARLGQTDSRDTDLMNFCDKSINVAGLGIGGYLSLTDPLIGWITDRQTSNWADAAVGSSAGALVKIYDPDQNFLVPQFTSILQLGGPRLWLPTPGYTLPPRGYLRVAHKDAPLYTPGVNAPFLANITLNGWREEAVQ